MAAFSDVIIFLSLTLLAVIIAIFVLAASLLREAIPQALEKQRRIAGEHSKEFENTIADMQPLLDGARGTGGFGELKKKLDDYERSRKQFEKASKRIEKKYQVLKMRGGVVYPAAVLLLSLALAGSVELLTALAWQGILLGLSLLAVAWVCYRIYEILSVVQSVAMTPEHVGDKIRKAFEIAMERHEEKKRPKLELQFRAAEPPFTLRADTEHDIEWGVRLAVGEVARSTSVAFFAPEGFDFPGSEARYQRADFQPMPNALTRVWEVGVVIAGKRETCTLSIKTPTRAGDYTLMYRVLCEGFTGEYEPFQVKVIE